MSSSVEAFAKVGIHLVQHIEGELAIFERVLPSGTQRFDGKTLEEATAKVEAHLGQHPGALGTDISRSDGASESLDETQRHSAELGPKDLPQPAADAAKDAPAEPEADSTVASEVVDPAPPAPSTDAAPPAVES